MANTPVLGLPMIGSNQAQKHIPANATFRDLDIIVQLTVLDRDLAAPPGSPAQGDRYIVAASPTGLWAGQATKIAAWIDTAWKFYTQKEGWSCYVQDEDKLLVWNSTSWVDFVTAAGVVSTSGTNDFTGANSFLDNSFTLKDNTDTTKQLRFELSGIATGTVRTLTAPNADDTIFVLAATQTVTGTKTFSGTFTVSAASASLGTSTAASTINVGTGATLAATAKTVNIGTAGVSTSTTTINIGSAVSGALGTLNIASPTVTFGSTNTAINISGTTTLAGSATTATLLYLGLGGATPDATNRLSLNTPGVLINNAGTSVNATVNKNATANDASFTFQTAFSTRALFGLLADDNFTIKVSPNGSSFFTGINIRNADGHVGVGGASADANNGLSVTGNLLLNRDATSINATLNKQATANDASFTFQTNFSTRALFGLLADDNFTIKTSTNGSTFLSALIAEAATGNLKGHVGGIFPEYQISVLAADRAGADVATAQAIFAATEDALTLEAATTYEFEAEYFLTRAAGVVSHTTSVLFGGTATFTSVGYNAQVTNPTGMALTNVQQIWCAVATATVITAANTSATENILVILKGRIRCNAAGTLIPSFQYSAAPGGAPTIKANSAFKIWPVGINTLVKVGSNWA